MPEPVHVFAPFAEALRAGVARHLRDRPVVCWSAPDDFAAGVGDVRYLLALNPPRGLWARAAQLRLIQVLGAGVDGVLPAPDLPAQVVLANQRGMSAEPMAEFGLSLVLALLKQLPGFVAAQREREWRRALPQRAAGSTLAILGMGAIGTALAERAAALGMRVVATQRRPRPHPAVTRVEPPEGTDALLAEADVVVLLLPLTPETRGWFSRERFARMKRGSYLVNLARGGIVDEAALADALREGPVAGAAFDVFAEEPLPPGSPLWEAPGLWITPHMAGGFPEILDETARRFAENVARLERGEPVANAIDREQGY
ncbi:MAG: D-2-hydroxyacid dehydrogenase [Myxococcota bacterium]